MKKLTSIAAATIVTAYASLAFTPAAQAQDFTANDFAVSFENNILENALAKADEITARATADLSSHQFDASPFTLATTLPKGRPAPFSDEKAIFSNQIIVSLEK